jgi:hypothetical protein
MLFERFIGILHEIGVCDVTRRLGEHLRAPPPRSVSIVSIDSIEQEECQRGGCAPAR